MKFFIFTMILLIIGKESNGQIQSGQRESSRLILTYKLSFKPDSNDNKIVTEKMQLLISNNISEFRSFYRFTRDSIQQNFINATGGAELSPMIASAALASALKVPEAKISYVLYKDNSKCIVFDEIVGKKYRYEDIEYPCQWNIKPDIRSIKGYTCQKALTEYAGRKYEAWFTKEIAVSSGPYKFGGLPGLILMVSDMKNDYVFQVMDIINPGKSVVFDIPVFTNYISTTKSEFLKSQKVAKLNIINSLARRGIKFDNPQINMQIQEKMKRDNNPMELLYR